jgi:hypothetical protein
MHKARSFFFVAAGMFLLALAYQLGARAAEGQATGTVECADVDYYGAGTAWFAVVNRHLYWQCNSSTSCDQVSLYAGAPIPGSTPVIACGTGAVVLQDGTIYVWQGGPGGAGPWLQIGDFAGGPTPALHQSWGQVKARYQNTPATTVTPGADNR